MTLCWTRQQNGNARYSYNSCRLSRFSTSYPHEASVSPAAMGLEVGRAAYRTRQNRFPTERCGNLRMVPERAGTVAQTSVRRCGLRGRALTHSASPLATAAARNGTPGRSRMSAAARRPGIRLSEAMSRCRSRRCRRARAAARSASRVTNDVAPCLPPPAGAEKRPSARVPMTDDARRASVPGAPLRRPVSSIRLSDKRGEAGSPQSRHC